MFSIQLHNLSFGYPDQESNLFNNFNPNIGHDWKLGVLGRNGLGKSKLLSSFLEIGLDGTVLHRQFEELSGGEKTKVLLVALFLGSDFAILDEPCTHLDVRGREHLRRYLNSKQGYLLVFHDRELLKGTTDHILHLRTRGSCELFKGGFAEFEEAMELRELHEERQRVNLEREVRSLKRSALEKKSWSFRREG